jgi:hypothetical protein
MDEKTITAVSTSLALMQIQVNALLLLLERHTPGVPIKEEFQQLISERRSDGRAGDHGGHQEPDL